VFVFTVSCLTIVWGGERAPHIRFFVRGGTFYLFICRIAGPPVTQNSRSFDAKKSYYKRQALIRPKRRRVFGIDRNA